MDIKALVIGSTVVISVGMAWVWLSGIREIHEVRKRRDAHARKLDGWMRRDARPIRSHASPGGLAFWPPKNRKPNVTGTFGADPSGRTVR